MTPETVLFMGKAKRLLVEAEKSLEIELFNAAGRAAYLAGFHAAQAFISERTGRTVKTHNGVRTTFLQLTMGHATIRDNLRSFLQSSYSLKAVADYETGPGSEVSEAKATSAVATAHHFVAWVGEALGRP